MPKPRRTGTGRSKARSPQSAGREWLGGRLSPPFFIHDRDEPYRAGVAIWMELPSGLVVASEVFHPDDAAGVFADTLRSAMERPLAGPPRRPERIRVADESLAEEVRGEVGTKIPVDVAPTPELDELQQLMTESASSSSEQPGYLEDGRISPQDVGRLFAAADLLHVAGPWKVVNESQLIRVDIPALGVDGACISVIGEMGVSRALMIFPSAAGYDSFLEAAERADSGTGPFDFGTDWLALELVAKDEVSPRARQEIAEHGWHLPADDAYPWLTHSDQDGTPLPLVARDVQVASACAFSFSSFFFKHNHVFQAEKFEPICESYYDDDDLEVRFTVPYDAIDLFDVDTPPGFRREEPARPFRPRANRNAPCPCGSGRKYKKCHLSIDEREHAEAAGRESHHDLDARLAFTLADYAIERFGKEEWGRFAEDFYTGPDTLQLARPWSVYGFPVQERSVVDWYLEEHGASLPRRDRAWLEAQRSSWLSVWEVIEVERGRGLTLRDLLSHETRQVREVEGSRSTAVREAMLARVVDADGVSLICGVHPQPLPPLDAADLVRRARGRLRRKRAVPLERLRDPDFGRYLIRRWEKAVEGMPASPALPQNLQNTDGDPLLWTIDHFDLVPGARREAEARVAALKGVEGPEQEEENGVYVFLRRGGGPRVGTQGDTVIGRALFSGKRLRLETNSVERADALRERIEAACGNRILFRAREHADPLSSAARGRPGAGPPPKVDSPELQQVVLDYKRRHYADWIDHELPGLNGKTPREAARSSAGRAAVDALLKEMERQESRLPKGEAFDFSGIRRELRLDET